MIFGYMKIGPVTKLVKGNTSTSEKIDDDVMSANCDVVALFSMYVQFAAIQKPDSKNMIFKTYIFINSDPLSYRTWKQLKNL